MNDETQIRATFKDTVKAQNNLRVELDRLENNNTVVSDDKRGDFFELLANALLGLDFEKKYMIQLPDKSCIKINNFGEFIRCLAYYDKDVISYDFLRRYGKIQHDAVKIGYIWHEVKFIVFGIYPEALAMSIRISKEIVDIRKPIKHVQTVQ